MPDTMISTETAAPQQGAGILDGYRSNAIGALVAARAKASAEIKRVVKDKSAKVESRKDGRNYSYAYADLANVLEAVDDALAANDLALFQTMQERRGATVLVTTLAHSSDQWISSEIRVASTDAGPQVFGSSLTYMRRYSVLAILGIAPDNDDDGKHAQDRADQQARQKPAHRAERPTHTDAPSALQVTQQASGDSGEPVLMQIETGRDGLLIGRWVAASKNTLAGKPEQWRRAWLELHGVEVEEVRRANPDWASKLEGIAIAPDAQGEVAA